MYLFLISVVFFYSRYFSLGKEVRILQLHHYQSDRQITYLLDKKYEYDELFYRYILHVPFLCILCFETYQDIVLILFLIVYSLIYYKENKKQKRSLVYTKRVIRLYMGIFLFYTLLLCIADKKDCLIYMILFLMMLNKEVVFIVNLLFVPMEHFIRNYYVKKAKHKLDANETLIKIGVVGSYGKTSTKNIVYELLKHDYLCVKSDASYNNLMGNTITILNKLKRMHMILIAEMGSDHVGEIGALMKFIKPQYVVITSIGNQHLNTFGTQNNIVKEKMSPLSYLKEKDYAILNIDNTYIYQNQHLGVCKKITYGECEEAEYRIKNIQLDEEGSSFTLEVQEESYIFKISLLGYYNVFNVVAALVVAHLLGVSFPLLQECCMHLKPIEHRLYSIRKNKYVLIDNAYNSNVYSFKNSMRILHNSNKYKILITPGLIDLKEDDRTNEMLMEYVVEVCDEVVLVGKRNRQAMLTGLHRYLYTSYKCVDTMEEALEYVDKIDQKDYVVLIENDIDKVLMNQI